MTCRRQLPSLRRCRHWPWWFQTDWCLANSGIFIALLFYPDMCWSFFVMRAYTMLIPLKKRVKKFEHKQQTFSVELNFRLGSYLTLVLAQPCKQFCWLCRGCDASKQVVEMDSSVWQAGEGQETHWAGAAVLALLGLLAYSNTAAGVKLPHIHCIALNLTYMVTYSYENPYY